MDGTQFFGLLISVYLLLLAGFAALTGARALEEGDREGLAMRLFWSVTKTTLFVGFPGVIGVLWFFSTQLGGGGDSGIMSRDTGLFVLFFIGALGLLFLWVGAITMGFIGAALTRNLKPMVAAGVLFLVVGCGPLFMILVSAATPTAKQRTGRR